MKTHITKTQYPAVTNCTCGNQLIGRPDGTDAYRVQRVLKGKSWPTVGFFCADCADDFR